MNSLKGITFVPNPMKRYYPDAPDHFHIPAISQTDEYRAWKLGNGAHIMEDGKSFRVPKRFRKL